ncbi:hypothetical protein ES703_124858 [subsurface metagenome]
MDPIEEAVKELKELNATNRKLLEIQGLQFALEPTRYIARKLRSGEAISQVGFWYQLVGGGATAIIQRRNPEGYVAIIITEGMRVSQNGVFEFIRMVDDQIIPEVNIPRAVDFDFSWAETLPFSLVVRDMTTISITNHDAADQWMMGGFILALLRKDVWERDSKLMDMAAERYMYPAPPPPPAPA